jgi:hypothetical protein
LNFSVSLLAAGSRGFRATERIFAMKIARFARAAIARDPADCYIEHASNRFGDDYKPTDRKSERKITDRRGSGGGDQAPLEAGISGTT